MESKICPLFDGILGISREWESSEVLLNCPLTSEEGSVIHFFGLGLGRCFCRPQKTFFTVHFYKPGILILEVPNILSRKFSVIRKKINKDDVSLLDISLD